MNPLDEPMDNMDRPPVSPWPIILKYGGFGSLALIFFIALSFFIGDKTSGYASSIISSFASSGVYILVYALIMIFSIKEYRDKFSEGYISLGKGMLVSYGSAMLMGVVGLLFTLLYLLVIDPNYTVRQLEKSYGEFGLNPSGMASTMDMYTPTIIAASQLGSFILGCIFGVVMSLIISAIMKKDRPYNSA